MADTLTFLTEKNGKNEIDYNKFRALLSGRVFSLEDDEIIQLTLDSLKNQRCFPFKLSQQELAVLNSIHPTKLVDYIIYRYKFKIYPLLKKTTSFPIYVLIEPTSVCNLRCVMCFQRDKTFTRKPYAGLMNFELFERVIDEIHENGTKALTLASRGEPLLHPQIAKMLQYASNEKFIDLKLNTNATRLTEQLSEDILRSDVNELVFSIDSHEKQSYEKIRVGGIFDEVLENIVNFHKIRDKKFPNSKLKTRVSGVKFLPEQDKDKFAAFWSKIVDSVCYVDVELRWDTYNNEKHPELSHPCDYLWERCYVWYSGQVGVCDVDYKSCLSPGKFPEQSIKEIWHSDAYNALRTAHLKGDRALFMPCDRCGV
jgi:MoaA/NifB/PqqE/SkfB family radical SAM enzyme